MGAALLTAAPAGEPAACAKKMSAMVAAKLCIVYRNVPAVREKIHKNKTQSVPLARGLRMVIASL